MLTQKKRLCTNTHIFIIWMVGTSVILLMISGIFLRNQFARSSLAEPPKSLAKAVTPEFRPELEVRRASASFIEMRDRIQRQSSNAQPCWPVTDDLAAPSPA